MKKIWIALVIIILLIAGIYLGRHKLKSLLGMSPTPAPTMMHTSVTPTASASANNIYMTKTDNTKGAYLTDFQGMTLYVFDKDTAGTSTCYSGCAKTWPPYTSGATAQGQFPANITVITRTDGSKQFAWKGMPLYYYASDQKTGDILGDGVGAVWHIVKL